MKKGTAILVVTMFSIFLALALIIASPYIIDEDEVYINDSKIYISAEPHTLYYDPFNSWKRPQWVNFTIRSKVYTGDVDIVFGFDTESLKPKKIQRYNPVNLSIEMSRTCETDYFNYTLNPNHVWCYNATINNETNETELQLLFEQDFESGNLSSKTIFWTKYRMKYWHDFSSNMNSIYYDYQDMNKWYYAKNLSIIANQTYVIRVNIEIQTKDYNKYWFAIKPSGETIQEAVANDHFYALDPWVNGSGYDMGFSSLTVGLLAGYDFDDASGSNVVDIFGLRNGTISGTPNWTTGIIGGGLRFDGATNYVNVSNNQLIATPQTSYSWWVYPKAGDASTRSAFIDTDAGAAYNFIHYDTSDNIQIYWGSDVYSVTAVSYTENAWNHYVFTSDSAANERKFYVNGVLNNTDATAFTDADSENVYFGIDKSASNRHFGGVMDNMYVWNRTINSSDVAALYNAGGSMVFTPPVNQPKATITYPENKTYYNNVTELNYTVTDGSRCWYSNSSGATNSSDVAAGTDFTNVIPSAGSNTWTVYCNNTANDINSTEIQWTWDYSPFLVTDAGAATYVLSNDTSINVSATGQHGIREIYVYLNNSNYSGSFFMNFSNNNDGGNISMSAAVINTSYSDAKSIIHNTTSIARLLNRSLFIPITNNVGEVYICPDASTFTEINASCPGKVTLAVNETEDGMTMTNVSVNGTYYYKVINITGTGGGEGSAPNLTNGNVTPKTGGSSTDFYYNVTYTDAENDTADRVILIVNGTSNFTMTEFDSSDLNVTDGKVYNITINLPNGNHNFTFWAADIANISTNTTTYTGPSVDSIPPKLTVNSPQNISYNISNITFNITGNEALTYCNFTINNWATNYTMTNLTPTEYNYTNSSMIDGQYITKFWCNDTFNNINNTVNLTFIVDTTVPQINYSAGTNVDYANISIESIFVNTTWNETNPGAIVFRLHNDTSEVNVTTYTSFSGSSTDINWTGLTDGNYTYNVTLNDTAGNSNITLTRTVTIDTIALLLTLLSPENKSYNTSSILFNMTGNKALDLCNFTINNWATNYTMTVDGVGDYANYTNSSMPDGQYVSEFWCNSTVNIVNNTKNVTFIIDTSFPKLNYTAPTPSSGTNQTFNSIYVNTTWSDTNPDTLLIRLHNSTGEYKVISNPNPGNITYTPLYNSTLTGGYALMVDNNSVGYFATTAITHIVNLTDGSYLGNLSNHSYITVEIKRNNDHIFQSQWDAGGSGGYVIYNADYSWNYTNYSGVGRSYYIEIDDDYFYVGVNDKVWIYNVSNPSQLVANISNTSFNEVGGLLSYGDILYVTGDHQSSYVRNLWSFNKDTWTKNATYSDSNFTFSELQIRGDYLYAQGYQPQPLGDEHVAIVKFYKNLTVINRTRLRNLDGSELTFGVGFDIRGDKAYIGNEDPLAKRYVFDLQGNPIREEAIGFPGGDSFTSAMNGIDQWCSIRTAVSGAGINCVNFTDIITGEVNWTNFTDLRDGIYYFNVTLNDTAGNSNTTDTRRVIVDTLNPNVSLVSPTNNTSIAILNVNFTALMNDSGGIKNATLYVYNSTGDLYNSTIINFVAGTTTKTLGIIITLIDDVYTWFYTVFDWLGQSTTTGNFTLTVDNITPEINYSTGTNVNYANLSQSSIFVNTTWNETNPSAILFRLHNETAEINVTNYTSPAGGTTDINWTGLPDATYTYNVTLNDTAGSAGVTSTKTITLDNANPLIDIPSPKNITYTSNASYFVVNSTKVLDYCSFNLTNYTWSKNYTMVESTAINNTGYIGFATRTPPYEYCTNMTLSQEGKLNISIYSAGLAVLPYVVVRIRDSDKILLEEINDTDGDLKVITSNIYSANTNYGICFRDANVTALTSRIPQGSDNDFYIVSGAGIGAPPAFKVGLLEKFTYYNDSMRDGHWVANFWCNDSANNINNTESVQFEIDTVTPIINITFPSVQIDYHKNSTNITFNWSYIESNPDTCFLDYTGSNFSVNCTDNSSIYTPINITDFSNRNITMWMNDSFGNAASFQRNWTYKVFEKNTSYESFSYEGDYQTYVLNMTTDNASRIDLAYLVYNETSYLATKSGVGTNVEFVRSINVPMAGTANKTLYWNVIYGDSDSNVSINTTYTYNQSIVPINIVKCNSTVDFPYYNFTFNDEVNTTLGISAATNLVTFEYYLNNSEYNKTYSYNNATGNPSYGYCFTPPNRTLSVSSVEYEYSATNYPLRKWDNTSVTIPVNYTINKTLWLLSTLDGQYVTFTVSDTGGTALNGSEVSITRIIDGNVVEVGQDTTDATGTATFFLYPAASHTVAITRINCTGATFTVVPTQTSYAITLNCLSGSTIGGNTNIEGVRYSRSPFVGGTTASGNITFDYYAVSLLYEIIKARFELYYNNGTFITSNETYVPTAYCNATECYMRLTLNVSAGDDIKARYYLAVNNTDTGETGYILLEGDAHWRFITTVASDIGTMKNVFTNLRDLFTSWRPVGQDPISGWNFTELSCEQYINETSCNLGGCAWDNSSANTYGTCFDFNHLNRLEYSRIVFIFLFMAILLTIFGRLTGYDAQNPGAFLILITGLIGLGTFANGITGPGFFYYNQLTPVPFLNNTMLFITVGFFTLGYYLSLTRRYT